jgi:hypothetical protein
MEQGKENARCWAAGGGRKVEFGYWTVEPGVTLGLEFGVAPGLAVALASGIGMSGSLVAEICGTLKVLSMRARIPVCSGRFISLPLRTAI